MINRQYFLESLEDFREEAMEMPEEHRRWRLILLDRLAELDADMMGDRERTSRDEYDRFLQSKILPLLDDVLIILNKQRQN